MITYKVKIGVVLGLIALFAQAASPAAAADEFGREKFIGDLYLCILQRPAEDFGYNEWLKVARSGNSSLEELYRGFFNSPEYASRPNNNVAFLHQLYDCVLFRSPDGHGLAAWLNAMDRGTTRHEVLNGFLNSPEFQGSVKPRYTYVVAKADRTASRGTSENFSVIEESPRIIEEFVTGDVSGVSDTTQSDDLVSKYEERNFSGSKGYYDYGHKAGKAGK